MKRARAFFLIFWSVFTCAPSLVTATPPGKEQIEAFRSAKTVRIVVEQFYERAYDMNLPFKDVAQSLFEYAGLKVADTDSEVCDLTLEINASGEALKRVYKIAEGKYIGLYTGATLSGLISLNHLHIPVYSKAFSAVEEPPDMFHSIWKKNPSQAPFREQFRKSGSFLPRIMEMMGEIYGADILIAALAEEDGDIRDCAIRELGKIRDPDVVRLLIGFLERVGKGYEPAVVEALTTIGDPAVGPLTGALKNENWVVQYNAANALGRIGNTGAMKPLIEALQDKNDHVREAAVGALGEIAHPDGVVPLINILKDKTVSIRIAAAQALGAIDDYRAIEPLIAALLEKDVGFIAALSLTKITGQYFVSDWEMWSNWWKDNQEAFLRSRAPTSDTETEE